LGRVISTGNEELDARLGGGIPIPMMLLIEGGHGIGKSILALQVAYGALNSGLRVVYVTSEATVKSFLDQAKRVSLDVSRFYLRGLLRIYPAHIEGLRWSKGTASRLLPHIASYLMNTMNTWDAVVLDSFSVLASYADMDRVLDFSTKLKIVSANADKLVVLTAHTGALPENLMLRLRSICDGLILLKAAEIGGISVKVMEIAKLRGARGPVDQVTAFDVDPAFGIKLLPITLARG
jgi:flagellar protein FlaH